MRRSQVRILSGVRNLIKMKVVSRFVLLILMLIPFMDSASSVLNRKEIRYNRGQIHEIIITLNHFNKPIYG